MTIDEFVDELGHVADRFRWTLAASEPRQPERRAQPRFRLRGTPVGGPATDKTLDPITALWYARTGRHQEDASFWAAVVDALDLSLDAAEQLVAAADDLTWTGEPEHRELQKNLVALRIRLISAVGLRVPEQVPD